MEIRKLRDEFNDVLARYSAGDVSPNSTTPLENGGGDSLSPLELLKMKVKANRSFTKVNSSSGGVDVPA